jgi:hypothetical protein
MLCCVQAVTALKLLTQTKTCLGKTLASDTIFLFVHFSGPFSCCVVLFLHINAYWYIPVKNFHISSRLYFIIYSLYFYYLQFMFLLLTAIHTRYHCYSIRFIFVGFLICLTNQRRSYFEKREVNEVRCQLLALWLVEKFRKLSERCEK